MAFVSPRFREQILLHLFKNHLSKPPPGTPVVMGISGPSGEGKTYHVDHVLAEVDAHVRHISGGELEHLDAGQPAELLRSAYQDASDALVRGEADCAAVVLSDVETGIGNWGELVQYTVNRQTVFGELMHICDYPNLVGGMSVRRVPIIMTANDLTKLYGPLIRPGRMTTFTWMPSLEEKAPIIMGLYPWLSGSDIEKLLERFPGQPVAFFSHINVIAQDDALLTILRTMDVSKLFAALREGSAPVVVATPTVAEVVALGERLMMSSNHQNYLRPG